MQFKREMPGSDSKPFKVCEPYVVTLLNQTLACEWYLARFEVEIEH